MATLEENLKTFLQADTTVKEIVGNRISYNHVPQSSDTPYIFFQQTGTTDDDGIGDSPGAPTRYQYALECWDRDVLRAKRLGLRVQTILNKYIGAIGDQTVQAIYAPTQDDNYVARGILDDEGFHGAFLNVEVVP